MPNRPAGDARRLRETNSRLRALTRTKDEVIATQQKLLANHEEQLANRAEVIQLQAQRIDVLERLLAEQDKQIAQLQDRKTTQLADGLSLNQPPHELTPP